MWQECLSLRNEGEKMQIWLKTKIGPFLVISSVLAVWTFLTAQPVQAHVYNTVALPSCGSLPADAFFTTNSSASEELASADFDVTVSPAPGTGTTGEGNTNYRYARIIIPAIAAGELRVFDSRASGGDDVSAAALCRRGSRIASYSKGYGSGVHTTGHTADANDPHETFKIRAQVSPGDEEYIVVIDSEDPSATPTSITADFHGVIYHTGNNDTITDSFTQRGQQYDYDLRVTANGLLTVQTTGRTDTKGQLNKASVTTGSIAEADGGGSGGNFKIVVPVVAGDDYTVIVDGQTLDTRGSYTLDLDFKVAMGTVTWASVTNRMLELTGTSAAPLAAGGGLALTSWASTGFADDDTTLKLESGDEDYFFLIFGGTEYESLTIETERPDGEDRTTDTTGTLFGPTGELAKDTNSGEGTNFLIDAPVGSGNYVVEVTGGTGPYVLSLFSEDANKIAEVPSVSMNEDDGSTPLMIEAPAGSAPLIGYYHALDIQSPGALYVHTTGTTDTVGYLYGPDGRELANDDDSGSGMNFRLAANVQPGLYLVLVQGKTRTTAGPYSLVVNLVEGEELSEPTTPVDPTDPTCPTEPEVQTDAEGFLENPSSGGYRSGIGVISGWVCAANEVEVVITSNDRQGSPQVTLAVAYGTSRPDTVGQCGHNDPNTGFGMTYNFNHLREGEYTMRAFADGEELIGDPQTFNVVHLTTFAVNDEDRFLRDLEAAECRVMDFPAVGEDTILEWEQSTQNFMIIDAG